MKNTASTPINFESATTLRKKMQERQLSPVDLVDAVFQRIEKRNPLIKAYLQTNEEEAKTKAKEAEKAISKGENWGPLHGIPIAIKDSFQMRKGQSYTLGCSVLKGFIAQKSAPVIERLENAGAIIIGTTNCPEFLYRGTTDNDFFGATSTPFAIGKNSGGSSGGSAAAVADGMAICAHGTDGGGSIRIPASCCGAYGFKPSFGLIPNSSKPNAFNITPYTNSGPITRTVDDAELMLRVMSGPDIGDPFTFSTLPSDQTLGDFRIAYCPNLDIFPVNSEVSSIIEKAVSVFNRVDLVTLGIENTQQELSDLWVRYVAPLQAFATSLFEEEGYDTLSTVSHYYKELIEIGNQRTVLDDLKDGSIRTHIYTCFEKIFESYDFIISPTLAVPPVDNRNDGLTVGPTEINGESVNPIIGWCLTYLQNFTGHPACSIPAGMTKDGLPIGMQITGRRFEDKRLLEVSKLFENLRPWSYSY